MRVQLQQVVLNLILNAVEAMSTVEVSPRELLISTEQTRIGGVLVSVQDCGPGVSPNNLHRVFDHEVERSRDGTGDLSVDHQCARGPAVGRCTNYSRGAVFTLTLPGAGKELIPFPRLTLREEPYEDTVSTAAQQPA
jgi:signal transduction histidine kinase